MTGVRQSPRRSKTRTALAAVAILVGAFGTMGWRWYSYVTAGESPYDEVGIGLNSRLPAPLRGWGCAKLAQRFPHTVPPYGCEPERS